MKSRFKFGGGLAYPFEVLLVPTNGTLPVLSDKFFRQSGSFLDAVAHRVEEQMPDTKGTAYNFLSYQTGTGKVAFMDMNQLCSIDETAAPQSRRMLNALSARRLGGDVLPDLQPMCSVFLDGSTNTADYRKKAPTAAYGVIVSNVEPLSKHGHTFLAVLRKACEEFAQKYDLKFAISGTPTKALDMQATVYWALPIAAVATYVTASLFLMVAFRSLIIPIRSMVSSLLMKLLLMNPGF